MRQIFLVILMGMAVVTVQTQKLRNAVIYMGIFSLSIAFTYLYYNAPDVAIAEAVIGSALATILYIVALQKYKVFTIYYYEPSEEVVDEHYRDHDHLAFIQSLEVFCAKNDLEPLVIFTTDNKEIIMEEHHYSLIIEEGYDVLRLYGSPDNYKMDALEAYLSERKDDLHPYVISEV